MKSTSQTNSMRARREFSFSEPFENINDKSRSRCSSPSIAYEYGVHYNSKDRQHTTSPLHNLHYKYLPNAYQPKQEALRYKYEEKPIHEQRQKNTKFENMGQINKKIKNILDSIQNEQKRKDYYCQKFGKNMPSDSYCPSRPLSKFDGESSIQGRQISSLQTSNRLYTQQARCQQSRNIIKSNRVKQSPMIRNNYRTPLKERNSLERGSNQYSNMSSIKTQKNYQSPIVYSKQNEMRSHKLVTCPDDIITTQSHLQYNSRSRIKNSVYSNLPSSRFLENKQNHINSSKQKNISSQIDKIQQQIEELERIKKELKSDYDQTTSSNIKSSHVTKESKDNSEVRRIQSCKSSIADILKESQICIKNTSGKKQNQTIIEEYPNVSFNDTGIITNQLKMSKRKVNEEDVYVPKLLRNLQSKQKKTAKKARDTSQSEIINENNFRNSRDSRQNTVTPIPRHEPSFQKHEESKRQFNCSKECEIKQISEYNEVKGLLHHIDQQIKLDEIFRKIKKWFQRCRSQNKWKSLSLQLKEHNLWISQQCMKQMFTISSEEENPFYTPRQEDFNISHLVTAFRETEEHWATRFMHAYGEHKLIKGGFTEENIDISKRGFIAIEDLVRYINYEMDSFFRNRDVYLIYHRLKKNQKLLFSDIMDCLKSK